MRILVLSIDDLGKSYRLLRHIKSFASQPDSYVYAVGPLMSVLPREIEELANVKIHDMIRFSDPNSYIWFILYPIYVITLLFQIFIILAKVGKIDYLLIQSQPLYLSYICGFLIRKIKKCKLIVDVKPFRSVLQPNQQKKIEFETNLPELADLIIVPSRSMQGFLQLKGLKSYIIRDNPGTMFKPSLELRENIYNMLNISSDYGLIGVPFPNSDERNLGELLGIIKKTDSFGANIAFIIFGGGKNQKEIESKLKNLDTKKVKFFILPLLADIYPQIMGACDLGISLFGAKEILDLSPELVEMEWCCVPIATRLYGCVREVVSDETGFFFKTEQELLDIIKKVFVDKSVDINEMRIHCKEQLVKWDDSWLEAFSTILDK